MTSPTARTLAQLRKLGFTCCVVEYFNPHTTRRHDAFGFIDILAIAPNTTIGIQATSYSNISARVKKITGERKEPARAWLIAGNGIFVIGWRKVKNRWKATSREITLKDFE